MTNEEKVKEIANKVIIGYGSNYTDVAEEAALEMAEWKDQQYQPLVETCKDLISILQTSRTYHLGITALDSHEEIERKEREGNTALIRSIDTEINYANETLNELLGGK